MKVSILIPTTDDRSQYLERLLSELYWQRKRCTEPDQVEIKILYGTETTGTKRNTLMGMANGDVIAQFDDDDMPTDVYLQKCIDFANSGKDVMKLNGLYFLNGVYDRPFIHSLKYTKWWQDDKAYYRCPNHISPIRRALVKHIPYKDIVVGEDGNWSMDVLKAGVLKTEYEIKETIYLYYARSK
jgi:hypothetical protein